MAGITSNGVSRGLVLLMTSSWLLALVTCVTEDVCTGFSFSATCGQGEVLVIDSATYGRMEVGKCVSESFGEIGCSSDILYLVDDWCSGKKECNFGVPNSDLISANEDCSRELASYLRISYFCQPVKTTTRIQCSSSAMRTMSHINGLVSSLVTDSTGCGTNRLPWIIQAKPGQTIEVSLIDFHALSRARSRDISCSDVYGFVVEKTLNINQTICGEKTRESVVYRSKTNSVEIYLKRNTRERFIFKYIVKGCTEVLPPPHAWYKRDGNEAVIGCDSSDKEWRLTCSKNSWAGRIGNCTTEAASASGKDAPSGIFLSLDLPTTVIVAGIIGGAIVFAVAIIVAGVVYIQKLRNRHELIYGETAPSGAIKSVQTLARLPPGQYQTGARPLTYITTGPPPGPGNYQTARPLGPGNYQTVRPPGPVHFHTVRALAPGKQTTRLSQVLYQNTMGKPQAPQRPPGPPRPAPAQALAARPAQSQYQPIDSGEDYLQPAVVTTQIQALIHSGTLKPILKQQMPILQPVKQDAPMVPIWNQPLPDPHGNPSTSRDVTSDIDTGTEAGAGATQSIINPNFYNPDIIVEEEDTYAPLD